MGRRRNFITHEGTTVPLSRHSSSGNYYIIRRGKRVYLGRHLDDAVQRWRVLEGVNGVDSADPVDGNTGACAGEVETLEDAGEIWVREKTGEIKRNTIKDNKRYWDELVSFAKKKQVRYFPQLSQEFLREYRDWVKSRTNDSASFYSNRFAAVKAIIRYVLVHFTVLGMDESKRGALALNLMILKKKIVKGSKRYIKPDELHAMLKACDTVAARPLPEVTAKKLTPEFFSQVTKRQKAQIQHDNAIQFKAIYLVAVNLLFYPIDISGLTMNAIDFTNNHVVFPRAKSGVIRVGVLLDSTRKALDEWLKIRDTRSDRVFVTSIKTAWEPSAMRKHLKFHAKLAGVEGINWKWFRKGGYHAALQDDSVDLTTAKWIGGHATDTSSAVDHYVTANPNRVAPAMKAIGKFYGI